MVAANSGGIPDIVTDKVNGYLFDPDDSNGAIFATKYLLDSATETEQLKRNARKEAEKWGWPMATDQLRSYYKTLINPKL